MTRRTHRSNKVLCLSVLMHGVLALLMLAAPASAEFGIASSDFSVRNEDGTATMQAGSHPFSVTTTITFPKTTGIPFGALPDGNVKDVTVDLPPGLVGNPTAVPRCTHEALATLDTGGGGCPPATQIGVAGALFGMNPDFGTVPLYNMVPPAGAAAEFAFDVMGVARVFLDAEVGSGPDYGIRIKVHDISQYAPIVGSRVTLWGVPADPSHDTQRCAMPQFGVCPGGSPALTPQSAGVAPKPFLTLPTSCVGPLTVGLSAVSWQAPTTVVTASATTKDDAANPVSVTGCDRLRFDPTISVGPQRLAAGQPSGYRVDLVLPQEDSPNTLATALLKRAVVKLPSGTVVSPSAANGLAGCSSRHIDLGTTDDPTCPDASKIGTVSIDTPLLDDPLTGSVYLAAQNDNPFNSMLAIYLVAKGPGVLLKLPGKIETDPVTGQLTTTFDDTPQLPFSALHLRFDGGPQAPLANPASCGTKTATADLLSSGGQTAAPTSSFTISGDGNGGPCAAPRFQPGFNAGVRNAAAASSSPFDVQFTRDDGDDPFGTMHVDLPKGLMANVSSVPLCAAAAAAAGTCGAESQVGAITVGTGPGLAPFYIDGVRVYLTGPYKGAPFGLSMVVPAVAGPLNLGTVVVQAAVHVDPRTAQISVDTDSLPTMLAGIPLQIRDIRLSMDRAGFMQSPTSCDAQQVTAALASAAGAKANVANRFQIGDCQALPFSPQLSMDLGGKGEAKANGHPSVLAHVRQAAGQANLRKVTVRMPGSLSVDLKNLQIACKPEAAAAGSCPATAKVGEATAVTRILPNPLKGAVYLVEGTEKDPATGQVHHTLPKLWVPLRGDVALDLWANTAIERGQVVTRFDDIPDAAISSFDLTIDGGAKGILQFTKSPCGETQRAQQEIDGQNGKRADGPVFVLTTCPLKVIRKRGTPKAVSLRLGGLGNGKLTISGAGIRMRSRVLRGTEVATIVAPRTALGRRLQADGEPVVVRVAFLEDGSAVPQRVSVRVQ